MTTMISLTLALALSIASPARKEPVIGGRCEGCEYVFAGMPRSLTSSATIAGRTERGMRLTIEGTVRDAEGVPAPGIVVYAYQTNARGWYPRGLTRHGRLRGWALTDDRGYYRFETVRPGSYPLLRAPQHVHMHVIEPGRATYFIDDIVFADDPKLNLEGLQSRLPRGGSGLTRPVRGANGEWHVRRDISLRLNVPPG